MKRFKITAEIDADDEYDAIKIKRQIDRDLNRGVGLYLDIDDSVLIIQDDSTEGSKNVDTNKA